MGVKILTGMDMQDYAKLCDEQLLAEVLDEAGGFRTGCFGLGIANKDGYGRALLLVASDPGQPFRIVCFRYNRQMYPQDAEDLLWTAATYAELYGIDRMECEYLEGEGQEVFQRCGWSEPVQERAMYCVEGQQFEKMTEQLEVSDATILPFYTISLEVLRQFEEGADEDRSRGRYRTVDAPCPELSFGCKVDGRLAGYVISSEDGNAVEISAFYAEQQDPKLMGALLRELSVQCERRRPGLREMHVCTYDRMQEQLVGSLLAQTPHQRLAWQKSEWNA